MALTTSLGILDETDRSVLAFQAQLAPTVPLVTEHGAHEAVEHHRGEADVPGQMQPMRLGKDNVHCRKGTWGNTRSTRWMAVSRALLS